MKLLSNVVTLLAALGSFSAAAAADDDAAKPNVVLIFIDDMGYSDIGPFGGTKVKTPELDRLAAEGMKFHSFYATPVCSMSRACLMSGCYNARVSVPGVLFPPSRIGLNPEETTVAEVLKGQGYATACVGKWHLGHLPPFLPTSQGFDSYFGIPYSNDMTIDPDNAVFADDCVFREGQTRETATKEALRHKVPLMRGEKIIEYPADQATLTKRYTEESVEFIRQNKDRPFFLYLPHTMVHIPLAASADFLGKSGGGLLGDAIAELDWSVGQIMQTLQELKLDEKTLVIFTSDNGAATGSSLPFRGKKASNYEGGVREPCIMRWTGKIPAGTDCRQIAGNIDVLPTLAALAGAALKDNSIDGRAIDGRDISPLMLAAQSTPIRDVHLYFSGERLQGIRLGDWKLFPTSPAPRGKKGKVAAKQAPPSGPELYNLATDPYETKNVAAEHPDIVAQLRAEFQRREDEIAANKRPAGKVAAN